MKEVLNTTILRAEAIENERLAQEENAAFLRAETERYQHARLMGESTWEDTTTVLVNGAEMADAVDGNGDTMHSFLEDQAYFGDY